MPITEEHAGRQYPATAPYLVTRAKIQEFAQALSENNPAYQDVAPPTFTAVLAAEAWGALFSDPDLGLSLSRTVHVDQRFDWQRPLHVGDLVTAELTIDQVRRRGPAAFVSISVAVRAGDELVATASSTLMHTEETA